MPHDDDLKSGLLSESVRKALVSGLSLLFMTEEGIRSALGDMRLPKDALNFILQQTERTRHEMYRAVTDELKSFLRTVDVPGELRKTLAGLTVDVRAQIKFSDSGAASVKTRVRKGK